MRFLNKIKINLLLLTTVVGFGVSSCIMDTFDDDIKPATSGYKLPPGKYKVYFNIEETGYDKTRALPDSSQFVDGSHGEHELGGAGNFAIFLNEAGTIVEVSELFGKHEEHPEDWIEGRYLSEFNVEEDYQTPSKCLVILNGLKFIDQIKNAKGKNASEIMNMKWYQHYDSKGIETDTVGRNDNGRFMMTNSIRWDLDSLGNPYLCEAVPLPIEVVQDALEEEDDKSKYITVKVERMVAKATLSYQDKNGAIIPLEYDHVFGPDIEFVNLFTGFDEHGMHQFKVVKYRVRCTGWGMNALEKEGSFFKSIGGASYGDNWNDADRYRYHWAVDTHYWGNGKIDTNNPYPWQYRDAINRSHMDHYSTLEMGNTLKNYSYDDFVRMNYFEKEIYIPENTFSYDDLDPLLDDQAEFYAGTHFIMTAILETAFDADPEKAQDSDFTKFTGDQRTVYRDRIGNIYRYPEQAWQSLVVSFNYALQSQAAMEYDWFDWDGHGDGDKTWKAATGSKYALYYKVNDTGDARVDYLLMNADNVSHQGVLDQTLVQANIRKGDGQRMILNKNFRILNIKDHDNGIATPIKIYRKDQWDWVEDHNRHLKKGEDVLDITTLKEYKDEKGVTHQIERRDAEVNDILSIMFDWIGPIDHFNKGYMYYFAPTKHEENKFGVVRNNWYHFILKGIHNLGTSIDNPEDPIVPNKVKENDQAIDIESKILQWHKVDMNVPVLKQN